MSDEMSEYIRGEARPPMRDRGKVRKARKIVQDIQLAGLERDGMAWLIDGSMDALADLYQEATRKAGDDKALRALLGDMVMDGRKSFKRIHGRVNNPWGI